MITWREFSSLAGPNIHRAMLGGITIGTVSYRPEGHAVGEDRSVPKPNPYVASVNLPGVDKDWGRCATVDDGKAMINQIVRVWLASAKLKPIEE